MFELQLSWIFVNIFSVYWRLKFQKKKMMIFIFQNLFISFDFLTIKKLFYVRCYIWNHLVSLFFFNWMHKNNCSYGEENGWRCKEKFADYVWVLDPIDGTKSFITGIFLLFDPFFFLSLFILLELLVPRVSSVIFICLYLYHFQANHCLAL